MRTSSELRHACLPARPAGRRAVASALLAVCVLGGLPAASRASAQVLPLDEFSPSFLGMYRKVMLIEDDIRRYADRYGVDFDLARAVCLYESGGNAGLTSVAGAQGYFQVMPATFRELKVSSNIEGGIKYLAQMVRQFGREDRAVAAYNGGPGRVGRAGGLPLETLQYVLGVSQYRSVLKQHDASIRHHASLLNLETVRSGEDWTTISIRLGVPVWELRVHNPFLAERRLRSGQLVAYPQESRSDLFRVVDDHVEYRTRHGDNYIKLAFTLGLDLETVRRTNGLWQLDPTPAGVPLRIPLSADRAYVVRAAVNLSPDVAVPAVLVQDADQDRVRVALAVATSPAAARVLPEASVVVPQRQETTSHRVARGDTLSGIAGRYGTSMRAIQQANAMGNRTTVRAGETLRIPGASTPARVVMTHQVARGDTLSGIAERHGASMSDIQRANEMGSRTTVRLGETLRIPVGSSPPVPRTVTHRVAGGDTLAGIARRYGTSVAAIQDANALGGRTTIRVGEALQIPGTAASGAPRPAAPAPRVVTHRVARGDTLAGLAQRYGRSMRAIQQANGMGSRTTIRLGETLRIR